MSPRVYVRKFDWDEAVSLREQGIALSEIAQRLGVSKTAVVFATDSQQRERAASLTSAWQKAGKCPDCGGPSSRNAGAIGHHRCRSCAARMAATSVRDGELECVSCRQWKPDDDFPSDASKRARRGRHTQCRTCQTIARRSHRQRNREADNAYQREYRRRRRAAA